MVIYLRESWFGKLAAAFAASEQEKRAKIAAEYAYGFDHYEHKFRTLPNETQFCQPNRFASKHALQLQGTLRLPTA